MPRGLILNGPVSLYQTHVRPRFLFNRRRPLSRHYYGLWDIFFSACLWFSLCVCLRACACHIFQARDCKICTYLAKMIMKKSFFVEILWIMWFVITLKWETVRKRHRFLITLKHETRKARFGDLLTTFGVLHKCFHHLNIDYLIWFFQTHWTNFTPSFSPNYFVFNSDEDRSHT